MNEKSVIIIGAGIAGLAAGCYARMNGYKTTILELHDKPGGLCTAWSHKGYTVDGCIHWLVGSKPGSAFYRVWEELGAVQGREFLHADEYMRYEAKDSRVFVLYSDLDRLEKHLREIAPEDGATIRSFCGAARSFLKMDMPVMKPMELMSLWEKAGFWISAVGKYAPFLKWSRVPMSKLIDRFQSPLIRDALRQAWPEIFPASFLLMTMAWLHNKAAGYPVGGSLEFSRAIEQRYLALGGVLKYRARVVKVITENDRATGVRLADGSELRSDYVISAADAHATIFDMLDGRYADAAVRGWFEKLTPFPSLVFVGLGVKRRFDDVPRLISTLRLELPEPMRIADKDRSAIGFHIFNNDPTLAPEGSTAVVAMFDSKLEWWQELRKNPDRYQQAKDEVSNTVIRLLDRRFPGAASQVEMIDVATPVTFKRYTGNWQGSIEGWMVTPKTAMLQVRKTLPGLANFWLCGQWVEPGGGLPPSALSGRNVVQFLCAQDRKEFVTTLPEKPGV